MIKKTFTIECSEDVMARFERLLALFHWNSRFGHSSYFAMPLDGDGAGKFTVEPEPEHRKSVQSVNGDVEVAYDDDYGTLKIDRKSR